MQACNGNQRCPELVTSEGKDLEGKTATSKVLGSQADSSFGFDAQPCLLQWP